MVIIYFLIALLATTVGAMAGIGGGVIIKPILDFIGNFPLSTIGVLSSATVFSMAIVSIIKQTRYKFKLEVKKTTFIGIGSIIGGFLGEKIIKFILNIVEANVVALVQNIILAILLILVFIYMNNKSRFKSYNINNLFTCFLIGIFLGAISSFLSIGGGPINVGVLTIFFSMSPKEAAVNSIITILFSQGSKLTTIAISTGFSAYDLSMLPYMVIGGILGGLIGSRFNRKYKDKHIVIVFNLVLICLIILNIYNVISVFI